MPDDVLIDAELSEDEQGNIRSILHLEAPKLPLPSGVPVKTRKELADQYILNDEVRSAFELNPEMLMHLDEEALSSSGPDYNIDNELRSESAEESLPGSDLVSYPQTYFGLPVWEAGVDVVVRDKPLRITRSESTLDYDLENNPPVPASGNPSFRPQAIDPTAIIKLMGLDPGTEALEIRDRRWLIYRYEKDQRCVGESDQGGNPSGGPLFTLPVCAQPPAGIIDGMNYIVADVIFSYNLPDWGRIAWRAFIEVDSGAVLYLRSFVGSCTGFVFKSDPWTAQGLRNLRTDSSDADLSPLRDCVVLERLVAPQNNTQSLEGDYVKLIDLPPLGVAAPTSQAAACEFDDTVRTHTFGAVCAYYHLDAAFQMVEDMGFTISEYFANTTLAQQPPHPVPVDASSSCTCVNADPGTMIRIGVDNFRFGLLQQNPPLSEAADVRSVWHEFGHALLLSRIRDINLRFAHSAGDSLAAILSDPESMLRNPAFHEPNGSLDRYYSFPWLQAIQNTVDRRRHDRTVTDGWEWGGAHDDRAYESEQILSSTLFRIYEAIGGNSSDLSERQFAAHYMAFLIVAAIRNISRMTQRVGFRNALMEADREEDKSAAFFGQHPPKAFGKVVYWGFEKQGLSGGARPDVDVYIDDGRHGEYDYQEDFAPEDVKIWNRHTNDLGIDHQDPIVNVENFVFVCVRNRGQWMARKVVVKAFVSTPGVAFKDLEWPTDRQPMTTRQLPASGNLQIDIPEYDEKKFGPFRWTPASQGSVYVVMSVSATSDKSNGDQITDPIPYRRLIPCDNNMAGRMMDVQAAPVG